MSGKAWIIPPQAGFLPTLTREILRRHREDLPRVTVIFPTRRAAHFFRYYLSRHLRGSFFLPRIYAFSDWVNELSVRLDPRPIVPPAERAWWLYRIVSGRPGFEQVTESFDRFLPWGLKFSEVLEEFEREAVPLKDLLEPPEDLPPHGRAFLAALSEIGRDFREILSGAGVTTPAARLRLLSERLPEVFSPEGPVYLCGFAALSRAERLLFRQLLELGAEVFLEMDPGCRAPDFLAEVLRDLKLSPEILSRPRSRRPRLRFFAAADVHQEVREAARLLPSNPETPDEVLILLPVAGHLLPLLYALPEDLPVNITLGFPVKRSLPATFLLLLFELYEKRLAERYPVLTYLSLLKHPYARGVLGPWAAELHAFETRLRAHGSPYLSLSEIEDLAGGVDPLRRFHREFLTAFYGVKTPRDFARVLKEVLHRVLEPHRERLREARENREILARHFLYAFESEILPVFESSSFSGEPIPLEGLFRMFRELLQTVSAPFEGDPLCGVQVMGLLETRLLSFRKVIVLDANEGALPSPEEINPLLPEGLRPALSLPRRSRQEALERYYFDRLIASAKEVEIFYLSVTESSSRLPPRVRSRYVEALLWAEEKRKGKLFTPEKGAVQHLRLSLTAPEPFPGIPRGEAERREVERLLSGEISATLLETYLDCPARFYFRYLLGLKPPERLTEYDATALGTLIHAVLEDYFRPYLGREYLPREHNDPSRLLALFRERFERDGLSRQLGPERRFFVEKTAEFRLRRYLQSLEALPPFRILSLEEEERREHPGLGLRFRGKLDRVDEFETGRVVLDYKTGAGVRSLGLRRLREILEEARNIPRVEPTLEGLRFLRDRLPDLQLLLYLFLRPEAGEAVYVQLASGKGREIFKPLFYRPPFSPRSGDFLREEEIERLRERVFPALLERLIDHLLAAPYFFIPEKPPGCRWCDYLYACPGRKRT